MLLMGRYRRQSSTNRRTVDFTASGRSLMWHKNRSGHRAVPCGTPESTWTASDSSPFTTTFICLLVRKSHSHELILPVTRTVPSCVEASCEGRCQRPWRSPGSSCRSGCQHQTSQGGRAIKRCKFQTRVLVG